MTNFHASIQPFLEEIRTFNSPNPEALPQRSNFDLVDEYFQFRQVNRGIYSTRKDEFVEKHLNLSSSSELSGLYFFFNNLLKEFPFFYIGKADNLFKRLSKHFITFDYFFYSAAFPKNYGTYYSDCIRFYAEGRYEKNKMLYKRQFEKFKLVPFTTIGWIADSAFKDAKLLKTVENNSIFFLKPAANGTKGSAKGNAESRKIFEELKHILRDNFSLTLPAG